ncbi:MAG: MipA/OmpV family protein [Alteromonadaceae bacterium]|nr:MipA/OmpV family protein [Alteromonadaceae bacterium]
MKTLTLFFILCSFTVFAEQTNNNTNTDTDESLITVGEWHFSVAMGVGERTNLLVGSKDIPLYFVPSFQYYLDNFYFDNGDLGYTFFENDTFVVSALTKANSENSYFSRWHPQNIFDHSGSDVGEGIVPPEDTSTEQINIKDISKRKLAFDAGIQVNWFASENLSFLGQLKHDINNVYSGYNGNIKMFHRYTPEKNENLSIQTTLGFYWASSAMIDYYYGLDEKDELPRENYYQGKSSVSPFAKIYAGYRLNKNWKAFFSLNYKHLGSGIKDSPIVDKNYTLTSFIGVSYVFAQ